MADRNFNRDRNRPYDNDFNDEDYGQEYPSRRQSDWDYSYGGNYGRGYNANRGYGERIRYGNYGSYNRGMSGFDRFGGYNRYGGNNRTGSYNRDMSGYATNNDYDYGFDNDNWYRPDYGRGQGRYGYSGYGYGRSYGRNFGRNQAGYESGSNRYGSMGYGGGYENDYDYDFEDYEEPGMWTYEEVWIIPGPFSGIGPEGYQRSDDRIREDINERLTQHGRLNARNIQVDVNNCEVTLKGNVDSRQAKRMAENVAESVSGVKDVHNQLRVQRQSQMQDQTQNQRSQQTQQQGKAEREGQSQRQR